MLPALHAGRPCARFRLHLHEWPLGMKVAAVSNDPAYAAREKISKWQSAYLKWTRPPKPAAPAALLLHALASSLPVAGRSNTMHAIAASHLISGRSPGCGGSGVPAAVGAKHDARCCKS
jgi:hypothetical protein